MPSPAGEESGKRLTESVDRPATDRSGNNRKRARRVGSRRLLIPSPQIHFPPGASLPVGSG